MKEVSEFSRALAIGKVAYLLSDLAYQQVFRGDESARETELSKYSEFIKNELEKSALKFRWHIINNE